MPNPLDDRAVCTLDDLKRWEQLRPGLPPSLAVLGHPVAHSVSPQMHNAALAELAKKYPQLKDWRYFKFDIEPDDLEKALDLLAKKNFKGINLTLPHKAEVLKSPLVDAMYSITPISAVNTLVRGQETWQPFNTDEDGFYETLKRELKVKLKDTQVVILGAGGVAWLAAFICVREGCSQVWIGYRDAERRGQLLADRGFSEHRRLHAFDIVKPPFHEWRKGLLVINSTSLGLKSNDPMPISVSDLPDKSRVFDMVYQRNGTTSFVEAARKRGLCAADGLSMLIWQGAKSLTLWLKTQEGIDIQPGDLAPTMMNAACDALQIPRRVIAS